MKNIADLRRQFSRLPHNVIAGAYRSTSPAPVAGLTQIDMVNILADAVYDGNLAESAVTGATPLAPVTAPVVDSAKVDAASQVANRAEALALTLTGDKATVHARLGTQGASLALLNDKCDSLRIALDASRVDDTAVRHEVAKAIADAFAPFKQAVIDAGAQAVVAEVSGVHVVET
jgi:hypothetical protein